MPRTGTRTTRNKTRQCTSDATRTLTVPGHAEQVPKTRSFIAATLAASELRGDLACLLGTELVANAVRHSDSRLPGGTVTVSVTVTRGEVTVEVTDDGGPTRPVIREQQDPCAEGGRGLFLVAELSAGWGYRCREGKLTTWFKLPGEAEL